MQGKYQRLGNGQVVGVGLFEIGIIGVESFHCPFQRAPGVDAAGPRGIVNVLPGLACGFVEFGRVGLEKGEVRHYAPRLPDLAGSDSADIGGEVIQLLIQPTVDTFA